MNEVRDSEGAELILCTIPILRRKHFSMTLKC